MMTQKRIASLGQQHAALGGRADGAHGQVLIAIAARQIDQQGRFLGIGKGVVDMEHQATEQILGPDIGQDPRGAHLLPAVKAGAVGLGDHRIAVQAQLPDAGLLGGQLAVECGDVARALTVEGL